MIQIINILVEDIKFDNPPNRIPVRQKSESEKVVPDRFNPPVKGITSKDNTEINIP